MSEITIVVNVEVDPPELIGEYLSTDEDTVVYSDPRTHHVYTVPEDCVRVVTITL